MGEYISCSVAIDIFLVTISYIFNYHLIMSKVTSLVENCDLLIASVQFRYNQSVCNNKTKSKEYHTVETSPKCGSQKSQKEARSIPITHIYIHDCLRS